MYNIVYGDIVTSAMSAIGPYVVSLTAGELRTTMDPLSRQPTCKIRWRYMVIPATTPALLKLAELRNTEAKQ